MQNIKQNKDNQKQLREYQRRMIRFLYNKPSAILSVGMGLGKTAAVMVVMGRRLGYSGLRKGNKNK